MGWLDTLSKLGPLIGAGAAAGGSIYGAKKMAASNDAATAAQMAANAEALKFEQQKYGDLKTRIAPWIASGQSSNQRMAELLHLPTGESVPAGPPAGGGGPMDGGPPAGNGQPPVLGVAPQGSGAGSVTGMASNGAAAGSIIPGVGNLIGAGAGALVGLAVRAGGNNTNRQRQAFAKSIIGTEDTVAFDNYLREKLGPSAEALIKTAHQVIGRNDTTANQQWMEQVNAALSGGGGAPRSVTLRHPQSGATKTLTDPSLIAHYLQQGAERVSA